MPKSKISDILKRKLLNIREFLFTYFIFAQHKILSKLRKIIGR